MQSVALTIAGSDPSGGAGLQADLKTFHQHAVYGMSVVTLITVQNTCRVSAVEVLAASLVLAQLDAVLEDIPPQAAKTGALGNGEVVEALAERAAGFEFPLVIDPVMISKHGIPLMDDTTAGVLTRRLLPHAFLVTPNLSEAAKIAGRTVNSLETMEAAAQAISQMGPPHVLVKGGHLEGEAVDVLLSEGEVIYLRSDRLETPHTHGTGCVTSAAITARLARGESMITAAVESKKFITQAIQTHPGLGQGLGPVNLHTKTGIETEK